MQCTAGVAIGLFQLKNWTNLCRVCGFSVRGENRFQISCSGYFSLCSMALIEAHNFSGRKFDLVLNYSSCSNVVEYSVACVHGYLLFDSFSLN